MTLATEAIARYHKLIESEPYIELGWADALQERLRAAKLTNHPMSPVLRPHFLTSRDHSTLEKATTTILSAIRRAEEMAMATPTLWRACSCFRRTNARGRRSGLSPLTMTSVLDASLHNGNLRFLGTARRLPRASFIAICSPRFTMKLLRSRNFARNIR